MEVTGPFCCRFSGHSRKAPIINRALMPDDVRGQVYAGTAAKATDTAHPARVRICRFRLNPEHKIRH